MQHCGICSVLAELFRRIMCIGSSRRGSSDAYYPGSGDDEATRGVVTIEHTEDHGIVIHVVDPAAPTTRNRKLSDSDWLLLETLDKRCQRPLYTRRFLTMHKRRRKKLTTRLLTLEPALLDDVQHGQVQCVLDRVWQWPFNAFTLDTVTGGRSLPVLCVHLFHWYGLLDHFNLDVVRVWKLFTLVEEGYHSTNPYHNSIHATDVTQAMHCFLQEDKIQKHLTPLEIMSSLIAAVTHDLDHPGVNQPFLIATSNHLAALYENTSVLENHHWRSAIGCLLESRVAEQLGPSKGELEHQISSLILATDITRQQEFLTRFKRYLDQSLLDMHRVNDRHFILQIALKCADISNPCRPWEVSHKWSHKVCEEFFRQGDYERQLNLPVTSLCDRQTTSVPKIQVGFFRFVVSPLFEEWHRFLGTKLSHLMMKHLRGNQSRWEAMVEKEHTEETQTEVSDADVLDEEVECTSEEEAKDYVTGSIEMLIPNLSSHQTSALCSDDTKSSQRVGRRHSVPLSVPRPPPFAQTIIRRESLPAGENKLKRLYPSTNITLETRTECKEHGSSLSLASSCSGSVVQHSSGRRSKQENRPVSTENLLPEPSIASITTSLEASRLSSVLHGASGSTSRSVLPPSTVGPSRFLTRQQTFPPLQQFVRIRYMSTTAEMANCSESLAGIGSHSSSSTSSHVDLISNAPSRRASEQMADCQSSPENTACCKNGCGTPTGRPRALQHSNRTSVDQLFQCTSGCSVESDRDTGLRFLSRKEQNDQTESLRDKGSNGSKICDTSLLQQISGKVMTSDDYGKENVDPRNSGSDVDQDINISGSKSSILRRNSHQGLVQRRGSAPVGLLSRSDDNSGPTTFPLKEGDRFLRRGSVPIDITRQRHREGGDNRSNDSGIGRHNFLAINLRMPECYLPPASTHQHYVQARQGSAPVESSLEFCRLDANSISRNVNNGHVRNGKKILCRHNSGGLEEHSTSDTDKSGETLTCH